MGLFSVMEDQTPKPEDIARYLREAREQTGAFKRLGDCWVYAQDKDIIPYGDIEAAGLTAHLAQFEADGIRLTVMDKTARPVLVARLRVTEQDDLIWDGYSSPAADGAKTASSRSFAGAMSTDHNLFYQICEALVW